jgi:hypothetical protein
MAVSMTYVATMMVLMARPVMKFFVERVLGERDAGGVATITTIVIALTLSAAVAVLPLFAAERRLTRLSEND